MKLHRFIGDFIFSGNEVEITNPQNIKQIKGILRLEVGESIVLADGRGTQYEVKITSLAHDKIICEKIGEVKNNEPKKKVSLYLAILKKENFELAVEKAVECGVSEITPVITERTVKTGLNVERINKIIREASEQCERSVVPGLLPIMKFEDALNDGEKNEGRIIFHTQNYAEYKPDKNAISASIFIGPEGGFTEKEISLAKNADYIPASLGNLILRGETASTIAVYRAVYSI